MALKRLKMGLIGPGFIAAQHIEAVRRLGDVEVVALAGSSRESARRRATEWCVERAYGDYRELIADPDIDVVHNTTPNHLHLEVSLAALTARKHVISDKPLSDSAAHSRTLWEAARRGGASSALRDIGSHWCDLAEHVTGLRIEAVLADLGTVVARRQVSRAGGGTFSRTSSKGRRSVRIRSEDLATVLLRFRGGAKGCVAIGQVLPGHKNDLQLEVCGRQASVRWLQERQNELWIGRFGQPSSVVGKD